MQLTLGKRQKKRKKKRLGWIGKHVTGDPWNGRWLQSIRYVLAAIHKHHLSPIPSPQYNSHHIPHYAWWEEQSSQSEYLWTNISVSLILSMTSSASVETLPSSDKHKWGFSGPHPVCCDTINTSVIINFLSLNTCCSEPKRTMCFPLSLFTTQSHVENNVVERSPPAQSQRKHHQHSGKRTVLWSISACCGFRFWGISVKLVLIHPGFDVDVSSDSGDYCRCNSKVLQYISYWQPCLIYMKVVRSYVA